MEKNKIICLALNLVLLILLVAACTPQSTPVPTSPPLKGTTVAPTVASTEGRWEQTVAAAKQQEGKIVLYGEIGSPVRDAIVNGLKKKYGIEVEVTVGKAPEVAQKFMTERTANLNIADAFILGGGTLILRLKPQGVLETVAPLLIQPEAIESKAWPGGEVPFLDKEKTSLPLAARYASFVIRNTDIVKEDEIKSYQDLLNPKWKGKITLFDPTLTGSGSTWTTLILSKVMGFEEGKNYLRQFTKQQPEIIKDARLHVEWVARGKYSIGIGPHFASVPELQEAGAPIAWVRVTEGGMMHPGAGIYAVPDKPAHRNASIVLTNWLLTAEGQQAFSQAYGAPPIRLDVPKTGFDPLIIPRTGDKIYWLDVDFIMAQDKAMEVGKEIFGPLMK